MNPDGWGDAVCLPAQNTRHVGPVTAGPGRVAVVGVGTAGSASDEVADPVHTGAEMSMRFSHTRVNHVRVNTCPTAPGLETTVQGQRALIDPVEAPGHSSTDCKQDGQQRG